MPQPSATRTALSVVAAVVFVAVAARFDVPVPGSPVPQSLQTLAVVLVGAALGPARGALALLGYLAVGALGAPVFADGAAGMSSVVGPTGGYLVGFVVGAAVMGWAVASEARGATFTVSRAFTVGRAFTGAAAAHAVILGLGWARLSVLLGAGAAWSGGVSPFLVGGVVKSLVAAVVWTGATWSRDSVG